MYLTKTLRTAVDKGTSAAAFRAELRIPGKKEATVDTGFFIKSHGNTYLSNINCRLTVTFCNHLSGMNGVFLGVILGVTRKEKLHSARKYGIIWQSSVNEALYYKAIYHNTCCTCCKHGKNGIEPEFSQNEQAGCKQDDSYQIDVRKAK